MTKEWKCELCGVILNEKYPNCPLCNQDDSGMKSDLTPSDTVREARRVGLYKMWELAGVVAFSVATVVLMLNLLLSGRVSWSLYPATSAIWSWLIFTITIFLRKKLYLMIPLHLANCLGLLYVIDLLDSKTEWFLPLAMPLTVLFFLLATIIIVLSLNTKQKGFNILVYWLVAITIFCVGTELITRLFIDERLYIRWSAIIASVLMPISGILAYVHYRLGKGRYLDGFFHI